MSMFGRDCRTNALLMNQDNIDMTLEYAEISSNYTRQRPKMLAIEDVAKRKASRNHKKRHSVNAEIARFNARKAKDRKRYLKNRDSILKQFHELVKAYWSNEIENHPDKPVLPAKPSYALPAKTRTKWK